MFIQHQERKYWEMSPLEKQVKYKNLTPQEMINLHRKEVRKFAREQLQKRNEAIQQEQLEKELLKSIEKQIVKEFGKTFK